MVTLQNTSRRAMTILLDHVAFQDAKGDEAMKPLAHRTVRRTTVEHSKDGKLRAKIRPMLLPSSMTILAGERTKMLPNAVMQCRDVKKAVAAKQLRVLVQTEDEKPKSANKDQG